MKTNRKYQPVIGFEVHVELKTKSKMFCACPAQHFQIKPNTHTCPVCLGLPGALPVPNEQAIDWTIMIGLALNCQINKFSKFDRKNYFYPDLAKGYQISQYDLPFCQDGWLEITTKSGSKKIGIERVHLEEDTGKLIHKDGVSLIDFNRSGVPLVEIVTKPNINSAEEADAYLKKLRQIIRFLGVSDADMEKGSMRLEPNISLQPEGSNVLPAYKVEVKNINSFKFGRKAIEAELIRQEKVLASDQTPIQETRGFNESTSQTYSQRTKEEAADYRYFPEPDISPIKLTQKQIDALKANLPELPEQKYQRYLDLNIKENDVVVLLKDKRKREYFEKVIKFSPKSQLASLATIIVNRRVDIDKIEPKDLIKHLENKNSKTINDQSQITTWMEQAVKANPQPVADFKAGKQAALGFLIGQVMRLSAGKADPRTTRELILKALK